MICCNKLTPPLDQPFKYGTEPIRGLNLGGWLVLEPFITPSLFNPYIKQNVTEEYSLTKLLGPEQARELLERHYSTWVTENTFKRIRDLGLNHVRIPLGFWALGDLEKDEPYVPDLALDYLLQGLRWAAQYGIRVMVELHAAPGSQNGWNHSGKMGKIGWLDGTAEGEKNGQRTIEYMKKLLRLLQGPGMDHVSPLFGVLNEPAIFMLDRDRIKQWYKDAFAEMRDITGAGKGPWAVLHDGFLGLNQWEGFMHGADRLALADAHQYLIFDQNLISMSRPEQVKFPCEVWSQDMQRSVLKFGPTLVGEFSSATNDCATYLNGIGAGYRWDGTFMNENGKPGEAACQRSKNNDTDGYCSCDAQNRIGTYTPEYRQFLSEFTQTQMDAFEQGLGWFYWNFKTETNPLWSYFDGVDQG
ncbi:glycoside hydrolase superfamily [Gamsiella multidivaricata]|uniref:glycoside hydrolase superfamily n=1 Tax=Gamsiella multidivaricata TaxID=101098 RepID=UPI00221E6ECB|nr:glycoside hydrolase superfamily [Gamsiella multidivaricata]KAI7816604.1 glycoside hydrolase superfamily [Gamsiella multidivaricata]